MLSSYKSEYLKTLKHFHFNLSYDNSCDLNELKALHKKYPTLPPPFYLMENSRVSIELESNAMQVFTDLAEKMNLKVPITPQFLEVLKKVNFCSELKSINHLNEELLNKDTANVKKYFKQFFGFIATNSFFAYFFEGNEM